MKTLHNKLAVVTGAGSGIGRALALALAHEGVHLDLLDIDRPSLSRTVSECRRAGVEVFGRHCDVADPGQIGLCVAHVLDRWGGIDLLVNNAGIAYYGKTELMSTDDCRRLLEINLHAPIHFTRKLLPSLLEREGHVLNVASFLGLIGARKVAVYNASKFGLVGFTESLRAEYGRRGLGATALCPGFVDTSLFDNAAKGADQQSNKQPPQWMLTSPERIAQAAIRGIKRNRAVVVPQHYARLAYYGKRFVPGLIDLAHHLSRKRRRPAASQRSEAELPRKKAA